MIREVAVFVTRECNLACSFCKVRCIRRNRQLNSSEWKIVFEKLKEIKSLELVVVYGGEPLMRPDIYEILSHLTDTKIPYTLISNSTLLDDVVAKKLIQSGLTSYTASIDFLLWKGDRRSDAGWSALNIFHNLGLKDVTGNIIAYRNNFTNIPEVVKELNKRNMWSIIGLCQFPRDKDDDIWSYRSWNEESMFRVSDLAELKKVMQKVFEMKLDGYLVHNIVSYLKTVHVYAHPANRFKWHCRSPVYMTIDEDGSLMACPDYRGSLSPKINLVTDSFNLSEFESAWFSDTKECPGCFYNHQYQAEASGMICHLGTNDRITSQAERIVTPT